MTPVDKPLQSIWTFFVIKASFPFLEACQHPIVFRHCAGPNFPPLANWKVCIYTLLCNYLWEIMILPLYLKSQVCLSRGLIRQRFQKDCQQLLFSGAKWFYVFQTVFIWCSPLPESDGNTAWTVKSMLSVWTFMWIIGMLSASKTMDIG